MITLSAFIRFLHLASSALLLGSFAFQLLVARPALRRAGVEGAAEFAEFGRKQIGLAKWTLAVVFGSGLIAFWLQVVAVAGVSPTRALNPEIAAGVLLETRYGIVWLGRMVLLLALASVLYIRRGSSSLASHSVCFTLAALLLMSLALSGHSAAGEGLWLCIQLAADALHLLATGAWLGALPPFALFLAWIGRVAHSSTGVVFKKSTRRFSLLGLASVITLAVTGFLNAWSLVGAIPPLVGTSYGKLLIAKLIILLPLVGVATINLFTVKPNILALASNSLKEAFRSLVTRLKRNVVTEASLGTCILLIVGAMSVTPPARHIQPDWPFSFRWSGNAVKGSAKIRSEVMVSRGLAVAGIAGLCYALFRRRHRHFVLGASFATLVYGGLIGHHALSIDAYPTTYLRPAVAYNAISVANGASLYQDACAGCHGTAGYGDGPAGKGLKPGPADLTANHTAEHTAGDLFWWLTHGVKGSAMPGFSASLEEEERWDIINFVRALSSAERARQMTARVEPVPWLVAPDFVYRTAAIDGKSLKDHRGNNIVLLVLFTLPDSRSRLEELNRAYPQLKRNNVEILAVTKDTEVFHQQIHAAAKDLPVITDGGPEVFETYALFRRSFSEQGSSPDPPVPPHLEFIIDRQGYVRARWIPRDGAGWDIVASLVREIDRLNNEKPSAPAPEEHVH